MPTGLAAVTKRHQRRPGQALTARERQERQDIEDLRAEIHQLRAQLAAVVDGQSDAASPTIETARAYLALTGAMGPRATYGQEECPDR